MKTAIVGNGEYIDWSTELSSYEYIIALDGGANHCRRMGVSPTSIIGDTDSITRATMKAFSHIPFIIDSNQNTTDLQKGLRYCTNTRVDLYCCTSITRPDHTQAAIQALAHIPSIQKIYTSSGRIECLRKNEQQKLKQQKGKTLSIVPLTTNAKIIIRGMKWSGTFQLNHTHYSGISNQIASNLASVKILYGKILLFILD